MSGSAEQLLVSPVGRYGKFWRVEKNFTVHVDGETDVIPKTFLTDFASTQVPRLLLPEVTAYHDWLYEIQKYSRLRSDQLFMKYMIQRRINFIIRWGFYIGVRLFGWIPWWRNARKKRKGVSKVEVSDS